MDSCLPRRPSASSGQFSALLYRINVRVQVAAQEAAVVVATLHHHDKIGHLRGAVVDVQTVEVMLHNAGDGITVGIARAAVNLHQHIKQIRQNMPAAHAGVDTFNIFRCQGGVPLAQLGQLLRYLRLLRGFVQIILPLGFVKIRVTLAPQTAKAVLHHIPYDPVRRKQLGGGGDVLGANLDVLFEVGEHLLFRLGVVILVQPAHDLHSVLPVGFRDVVYQMADHAVLIREGERQQQRHITDASGETKEIKVGDIATFEDAQSPQTITRDAQSRYMSVSAEIATGYNIGLVSQDVQRVLDKYELPDGYTVEMTGEDETINNAMSQLMLMLALALVFMYLIMVAQFQSVLSPFIIMFTIPLAFTGGFIGLILTNKPISVVAMIGFVMLSGIIVNNGIVLVDYINQLRKEGMEKRKAIAEAGRSRLRPIIMTALTTILGLVTMAMGVGMGSDMMQPMAIVTIGGLIYGTLLTLFVVPCVYDILNRRNYKKDEERLADGEANFE